MLQANLQGTKNIGIKSTIKDAPSSPGVYQMLNIEKQVIYVGKAKNLNNRLTHYIQPDLNGKVARMMSQTDYIEYIITSSEAEALILEAQLVKKFQPKFNILLKDDKSFPYLKLRLDHDYPQLLKYRGKSLIGGEFFGPFTSVAQVDATLSELQKIFKLRPCSDNYFASRKRPCLQYQIGRCYAPCVNKISREEYAELVLQAKSFLSGKTKELQQQLAQKMEALSLDLQFEQAAEIRDRIKALSYIQAKSGLADSGLIDADVIAIASHNNCYCIQVFLYRAGGACGNKAYFPVHTEESTESEVMESFISQFYQTRQPPKEIIISHQLKQPVITAEAINMLHNAKATISKPSRGGKLKLLINARSNAQLALENYLKNSIKNQAIFDEIKVLFQLPESPVRIEVYDNSHIMGAFAVGAIIVAGINGFDKNEYRIFNISLTKLGDDYAMLKEVLNRRFIRLKKEVYRKPDLMIIDGGKGHLSTVKNIMEQFGVNIPFVCMSKGPDRDAGLEQFHMPGREPFTLDKNLPIMKYLQILRDEAHNFAIKTHRAKRSKAIQTSSLDNIPGIGQKRKKLLLHHFGSYQAILEADLNELMKVPNISRSIAQAIKNNI